MRRLCQQRAFTLVELLIVMVIVAILAVTSVAFISNGVTIYSQGVERQEVVAQARFMLTRLAKELRHATPNSLRLSCEGACTLSQCLEFTPFKSATHYTDTLPTAAPFTVNAVNFDLNNLPSPNVGEWAVIYPLNSNEIYDTSADKRLQVEAYNSPSSAVIDEWQFSKAFAQESPTKRLYLLQNPVSFCVEGNQLFRYQDYGFTKNQLSAAQLQAISSIKRDLIALHISNNLAVQEFFNLTDAALTRTAVLNLQAAMQFNQSENIILNHEVHIPNVP